MEPETLTYHDDWPLAEAHLRAFWAHGALDRACIAVTAPRREPLLGPPAPPAPADLGRRWTDAEYQIAAADAQFRSTYFGGEAVPNLWINLGPGILGAYLGSEPTFAETTVWFNPLTDFDWERLPECDAGNSWWRLTCDMTRAAAEALGGKALVGLTDLGDASDVLAALRGTENLLLDVVLNPEPVSLWLERLADLWIAYYEELRAIAAGPVGGSVQWLSAWAPGRMYTVASDFSCMISPAMFERFIVPELSKLCRFLDSSLYHLDGPEALQHLDRLLAIPELDGIQWTPGAGNPPSVEWLPMLRRVQAAGKCLHVHDSLGNAERILRSLKPEGLFFQTSAPDEETARDLLRKAATWASGPRQ